MVRSSSVILISLLLFASGCQTATGQQASASAIDRSTVIELQASLANIQAQIGELRQAIDQLKADLVASDSPEQKARDIHRQALFLRKYELETEIVQLVGQGAKDRLPRLKTKRHELAAIDKALARFQASGN